MDQTSRARIASLGTEGVLAEAELCCDCAAAWEGIASARAVPEKSPKAATVKVLAINFIIELLI